MKKSLRYDYVCYDPKGIKIRFFFKTETKLRHGKTDAVSFIKVTNESDSISFKPDEPSCFVIRG